MEVRFPTDSTRGDFSSPSLRSSPSLHRSSLLINRLWNQGRTFDDFGTFYLNGSARYSEVFYVSERGVLTSSLILYLVYDHIFAMAFTQNTSTIIINILCLMKSELLYFYLHCNIILFVYISHIGNFF